MTNNLDTPATALHCTALHAATGDLPKRRPDPAPRRPGAGVSPQLTDADLVTLSMLRAMPGFASGARWLRSSSVRGREPPLE
ncbi:hypothetical protein [Streptomyces sp. NPDC059168]|uniref:hypothetical protein n=1 Tax=Streptomyces sp. NPDC059168 TaxID=3346753 RepID=UPI00367C7394